LNLQARIVVLQFNMRTVEPSDDGDKAKTQPVSGAATAALDSIEALEDVLALLHRNTRPMIGD
jgi:hypothetical protein